MDSPGATASFHVSFPRRDFFVLNRRDEIIALYANCFCNIQTFYRNSIYNVMEKYTVIRGQDNNFYFLEEMNTCIKQACM